LLVEFVTFIIISQQTPAVDVGQKRTAEQMESYQQNQVLLLCPLRVAIAFYLTKRAFPPDYGF
jgi:hypothetical protein